MTGFGLAVESGQHGAGAGGDVVEVDPLTLVDSWPVDHAAVATIAGDGDDRRRGDVDRAFHLTSITKVISTWAMLVAIEEGAIGLDAPVGQPGCTLRHLLSHAGGYGFVGSQPVAAPGQRRIYSNAGIELAAAAVEEASGIAFATYVAEAVLEPLGMAGCDLRGSAAHGMWASVDDLVRFVREVQVPTLLSAATVAVATSVHFADLDGIVPGIGRFRPCPWGLGVEVRGHKQPHWTGTTNSPTTFGHFGGSGTMMWIDPVLGVGLVALTDRSFDAWATDARRLWPALGDAVIAAQRASSAPPSTVGGWAGRDHG